MRDATLITTAEQLAAAVFRMRGATRLALDTEFMRERTYYPQLCLVQVATDADCVLVDPLNGLDLTELLELLAEPGRVKVVHAARQDLEVLYLAGGRVPAAGVRHADRGRVGRACAADRLCGARRAPARPLDRQGPDAHRLVAPATDSGAACIRGRRRASPARAAHVARRGAAEAGPAALAGRRTLPRSRTRRCIARSRPMRGAA